jgi:FimV-like protein
LGLASLKIEMGDLKSAESLINEVLKKSKWSELKIEVNQEVTEARDIS